MTVTLVRSLGLALTVDDYGHITFWRERLNYWVPFDSPLPYP